jgi:DNA-binding Lrp family transcriptional regulator
MLDEKSRQILEQLLKDSRMSFRDIGRKLNVSAGTVISRIKQMEKDKIIKGYSILLDHENLGYELTALTEIIASKGKLVQVEKEVSKIPNVCAVYDVTGETDAVVIAKFKDRKELSKYTKSLLALPFIERSNTHVVLNTVKEDFRLL